MIAIITLSQSGLKTILRMKERNDYFNGSDIYIPKDVAEINDVNDNYYIYENGILELTSKIFMNYKNIIYVMPMGVVIRAISPHLKNKYEDPAVVTIDLLGRSVISTLSGHEGGANKLSEEAAKGLHTDFIITTSTEAEKRIIVGMGCKKNTHVNDIEYAIKDSIRSINKDIKDIRLLVTIDIKKDEKGIIDFSKKYDIPVRIISKSEIKNKKLKIKKSNFVKKILGIDGVCVPCAMLGGTKTRLVVDKTKYKNVAVAVAIEEVEN